MRRAGAWFLLASVVLLASAGAASAETLDWDTFRGDDARTGVRGELGLDGLVNWTVDLGPVEGSAPTVVDGVIYVGGSESIDRNASRSVTSEDPHVVAVANASPAWDDPFYAIDAGSGETLWSRELPGESGPSTRGIVGDPTVVDGTVYLVPGSGPLIALDAETGERQWIHRFNGSSFMAFGSSPTVADGTVYAGVSGEETDVVALDAETGDPTWSYAGASTVGASSPAVEGELVYAGLSALEGPSKLVALDRDTGEQRWAFEHRGRTTTAPLVHGGMVVFGSHDDHVYALDAGTGAFLWTTELAEPNVSNQGIYAAPSTDGQRLYVGTQDYQVHALDPDSGDEIWKTGLGTTVDSTPVLSQGRVYVDAGAELHVLDAADGERLWSMDMGEGIHGQAPAVSGGQVFVANDDLYAVHADAAEAEQVDETPGLGAGGLALLLALAAGWPRTRNLRGR